MPYVKKKDFEQLTKKQITTSGLTAIQNDITVSEYDNYNYQSLQQSLSDLRNQDCIASTSLEVLKLPIVSAGFDFKVPEDADNKTDEIIEYLKWVFDNLLKGYTYFKRHALLALDYGLSMFEKVWYKGADYQGKLTNCIKFLNPIQNQTIWEFLYNQQGHFVGIKHERIEPDGSISNYPILDLDNLFYFSYNEEYGDIRGRSLLRPSRLPFDLKKRIMIATARAIERGAGIPHFKITGDLSSSEKSIVQQVGRTLANSKNAYVTSLKDRAELELLEIKNQQNAIPTINLLNKEMLYNSLTYFIISGIGENGSRASTYEHKTTYQMKVNEITKLFDSSMQGLCEDIINNSHFGYVEPGKMPQFYTTLPKQFDTESMIGQIIDLAKVKGVTILPEDEVRFREILGMPEKNINEITEIRETKTAEYKQIENNIKEKEEDTEKVETQQQLKVIELEIGPEYNTDKMSEKCKAIFELENAVRTTEDFEAKATKEVTEIYEKIVRDAARQLKKVNSVDKIDFRYRNELRNKIKKMTAENRKEGQKDVTKELNKLLRMQGIGEKIKLQDEPLFMASPDKRIEMRINALYDVIKNRIEEELDRAGLTDRDEIEDFITEKLLESQKMYRRKLIDLVVSGYTTGRLDKLIENREIIELYEYSAVLDRNLCRNCAPFDGAMWTEKEIAALPMINLNKQSMVVNNSCLGGAKCRCQLIPVKLVPREKLNKNF